VWRRKRYVWTVEGGSLLRPERKRRYFFGVRFVVVEAPVVEVEEWRGGGDGSSYAVSGLGEGRGIGPSLRSCLGWEKSLHRPALGNV